AIRTALARAVRIIVSHPAIIEHSPWLAAVRAKCRVVAYGVDAEAWSALPPAERPAVAALRAEKPRLVVAVGRLVPYKGFDVLVEAFAAVSGQLVIVGEGPERPRLSALIAALGLSGRVELAGRLHQPALRRLLHAARVFAFPSVSAAEAFGIAQLEAMAAGLPVVNTALPTAVPWVARDGQEAVTVPPADAGALAIALSALLDDAPRAAALGAAGRERVRTVFTEARYCAGVLSVWQEALQAAAVSPGGETA
ncbi:MAG: glycosyltransferase, partial [Elioraea tepidiphila]